MHVPRRTRIHLAYREWRESLNGLLLSKTRLALQAIVELNRARLGAFSAIVFVNRQSCGVEA